MKTGLRFDKVALGLVEHEQSALGESVPDGKTLVFTVTAPIRLAARTAAALEDAARAALARRSAHIDLKQTIHGNRVRIALVEGRAARSVIGFVHNPEANSELILDVTRTILKP